jgi:hypothetical protein
MTLYTPPHPYPSLAGLSTLSTLPYGSSPSHPHHPPSLQFPKGNSSALLTAAKRAKGLSTGQCTTLNAIPPPTIVPTPFGRSACSTLATCALPRRSVTDTLTQWFRLSRHAFSSRTSTSSVVTAAATLGGNDALSSSQISSKNPAHIGRQNSIRV